ncbi:MAG: right-handed parallel beta-helix repeat-containing protein [Phycisphaerales bacterium]|nr:right-handed parallel beta-helix repeat-containing protein [Phycisphaerales bacterium]
MIRDLLAAALFASVIAASLSFVSAADSPSQASATTACTFHCLSLYWTPEGGQAGKQVLVKFREAGSQTWREGLPMRYNPINDWKKPGTKTPESQGDYRGSIVNLKPGTAYEIKLTLEGTDLTTDLKASTWSENFPIASTVKCPGGNATFEINKSGTPNGYVLYDGTGSTIDTNNQSDMGINVNAEYIIIRGFTIKNVKTNGINIERGNHIVIESCDISKWGSEDKEHVGYGIEMNAGIYCKKDRNMHAVVIQRCKIHNPNWNTNSWAEDHIPGQDSKHPGGPQTIVFWEPEGNNVIRYNECWSDADHYYNDTMGGAFNGSYRGWPGRDSDIYGNYIANCWDDGIEIEGGGQNVRCWNNYIENTMMMIANAANSIGPLYIWQNVTGRSYTKPGSEFNPKHGNFMKMGYADSIEWMSGHMYVFNNTIFQGPENNASDGPGGSARIIKHCVTRNNIFHSRPDDTHSISTEKRNADNDFDYDLISHRVPADSEKNGIKGLPKYAEGSGFNFETKTGSFHLSPDSPGYRKALVIPNFLEPINGNPPDVGAHQSGTPPMVFGVKANFVPPDAGKE